MNFSRVDKDFDIMKFAEKQLMSKFEKNEDGTLTTKDTYQPNFDNIVIYPKGITGAERDEVSGDCFITINEKHEPYMRYGATKLLMYVYGDTKEQARNRALRLIKDDYEDKPQEQKDKQEFQGLEYNNNNKLKKTIRNFEVILTNDSEFKGKLKYDSLGDKMEFNGQVWEKSTDALLRAYIEHKYDIYDKGKLNDAITIMMAKNTYNPIIELLERTEWDGKVRIGTLFNKWLKVADTPLNREIERMMFAGGINRLCDYGCKFDDMVVFIGKQGCGKSTFCQMLSIDEKYFNEIKSIDENKGVEAIKDYWIIEFGELSAITKSKDIEATKAFLSRCYDNVRLAYEERVTSRARHCIFLGTTNKHEFLKDPTGNRRYYPVTCNVEENGNLLLKNVDEAKNDILQAWKEAHLLFKDGKADMRFDEKLMPQLEMIRAMATEDDYREGMIGEYLLKKDKVCVIQIWQEALKENGRPDKKQSNEIGQILRNLGWNTKNSKKESFKGYGQQKAFYDMNETLPF